MLAVVALAAHQWWLYAVLAADFVLRSGWGPSASPVAILVNRWIRPRVAAAAALHGRPPQALRRSRRGRVHRGRHGPVAGRNLGLPVILIGAVMVVFPALESLAGICVGCIVFGWLMRLGVIPESVCLECADITRRAAQRQAAAAAG